MDDQTMRFVEDRWRELSRIAAAEPCLRPAAHEPTALEAGLYPWIQFYDVRWPRQPDHPDDVTRLGVMMRQLLILELAHELAKVAKQPTRIETIIEGPHRLRLRTSTADWHLELSLRPELHPHAPAGFWGWDVTSEPELVERFVAPVLRSTSTADALAVLDEALRRRYLEPGRVWPAS